jgi:hypothetical protein
MNKTVLSNLIILLLCVTTYAQQWVISSGGNEMSVSNGSISWTLGETIIETYTLSGSILTQGFQQTFLETKPLNKINLLPQQITVFPNPFTDRIMLAVDHYEGTQYCFSDILGRIVRAGIIESTITSIDVKDLQASVYFIKISRGHKEIISYKLIKY